MTVERQVKCGITEYSLIDHDAVAALFIAVFDNYGKMASGEYLPTLYPAWAREEVKEFSDVDKLVTAENHGRLFVLYMPHPETGERELAGTLAVCVSDKDKESGTAEIKRLAVSPTYRRLGLGRALINHGIQHARDHCGASTVYLHTLSDMHPARNFYRSLNFNEEITEIVLPDLPPSAAQVIRFEVSIPEWQQSRV